MRFLSVGAVCISIAAGCTLGSDSELRIRNESKEPGDVRTIYKHTVPGVEERGAVIDIDCSPDGKLVVAVLVGNSVYVWKVGAVTGHFAQDPSIDYDAPDVNSICFSPRGDQVASSSGDGAVHLWKVAGSRLKYDSTFKYHRKDPVVELRFSPDAKYVVAALEFGHIVVWDVAKRTLVLDRKVHDGDATGVDFFPGSHRVATSGLDGTVKILDVRTGTILKTLRSNGRHQNGFESVAVSKDGTAVVAAKSDKVILWSTKTFKAKRLWKAKDVRLRSMAILLGSRFVFVGGEGLAIVDMEREATVATYHDHKEAIYSVRTSSDGKRCYAADVYGNISIRGWDHGQGEK